MPELPEVETVRKNLENRLKNRKIIDINVIYTKVFEKQKIEDVISNIKNQTIKEIKRRGKWLIFCLDDFYLLSHLRMEGKYLYRLCGDEIKKHELVVFNIDNEFELRYQDTRKFGRMYLIEKDKLDVSPLINLGLEPWDSNLNVLYLKNKYKKTNLPIKTVLLDQSIVVGVGNIYADEILFLSNINPHKKAKNLNEDECDRIIKNTQIVLEKAILDGGTTIRSYTSEEGVRGKYQNNLLVHQRENKECRICKNMIVKEKINGRSTYYCKNCQAD